MKLVKLAKDSIKIVRMKDGIHIAASLYDYFDGGRWYRWWDMYRLSDLPNNLITSEDLKRFGINIIENDVTIRSEVGS